MRSVCNYLADGLQWLYYSGGPVGGFIFGLLYAPIVITGMHQSFIAIETKLVGNCETYIHFPNCYYV